MSEFRYKQVIVFRSDLKLSKGKRRPKLDTRQCLRLKKLASIRKEWWEAWINEGQCKVVVKVKSEAELLALEKKAKEMALPCALIIDRGLTEIPPGTITCLGIGPAPAEKVDKITGNLPLL
jgi:PTH2 family peptidyl-tRNA hydrolase